MTPQHERDVEEALAVVVQELDLIRLYLKRTVMGEATATQIDETTTRAYELITKLSARPWPGAERESLAE